MFSVIGENATGRDHHAKVTTTTTATTATTTTTTTTVKATTRKMLLREVVVKSGDSISEGHRGPRDRCQFTPQTM